jgi:hypothetical protein
MNEQCPECECNLEPAIFEDNAYMRCIGCGWMRTMTPREFLQLPKITRSSILAEQANNPEIIKYYDDLDLY